MDKADRIILCAIALFCGFCITTMLKTHTSEIEIAVPTTIEERRATEVQEINPDYFTVISNKYVAGRVQIIVVEDIHSLTRYMIVDTNSGIAACQLKEKCW